MTDKSKQDLLYAIFAMNSYNRGYGSSILFFEASGLLGNWSILTDAESEFDDEAFDAGFYALAYKNGGEIVISYRGTDVKGLSTSELAGGSDPLNGYGLATG